MDLDKNRETSQIYSNFWTLNLKARIAHVEFNDRYKCKGNFTVCESKIQ